MAEQTSDTRVWRINSDLLGNDSQPYTTKQLFDYAEQCNREHENDPEWTPFDLTDCGDKIIDNSVDRGDADYIAAVPFEN